jgi:DNA primase large subunit
MGLAAAVLQPSVFGVRIHQLLVLLLLDELRAESREESLALAKQLAAAKADVHKLRASAARLNSRVEAAELMRTDAEVAAEQLRQRLERLVGTSHEVTKQRSDMAQVGCRRIDASCCSSSTHVHALCRQQCGGVASSDVMHKWQLRVRGSACSGWQAPHKQWPCSAPVQPM